MRENPLEDRGHILIADDNPNDLQYIVTVLREHGYIPHATTDANAALAFARNNTPDLILLDMHMPEIDGFEICRRLKADQRTRGAPIIFVSAESRTLDRVRAFTEGAVDYIAKPFQEAEALARIGTHLSLRRLAARLIEEKERAEAANVAKSQFLASMSHELRTPLNSILGYAHILKHTGRLDPRLLRGVDAIHESGEHLLRLINDILDLARIEAGKLELAPGPTSLATVLRYIGSTISVRADPKGLRFECRMDNDLPQTVLVDEKRLTQVLLNLLGNAVKFTGQGAVTLRVLRLSDGGAAARLRFEVEDTGNGIDSRHLETIFQPFEQVGGEQQRVGGAGLGLAISRRIVQSMGSDIQVQSEVNRGSRFWFDLLLPMAQPEAARKSASCDSVRGYLGPQKTALIVDDIAANREVAAGVLGLAGMRTLEACDVHDALEQLRAEEPDLVIMDVHMPQMSGLDATRLLRQTPRYASLPIIAVSASSYESDRARALAAGANAFLPKPLDAARLFDEVGDLLHLTWTREPQPPVRDAELSAAKPIQSPGALVFPTQTPGGSTQLR